jgi:hypothetical protein
MKRKVHITDANGRLIYTRLWDEGGMVLRFFDGFGFVDKLEVKRSNWRIKDGWPKTSTEIAKEQGNF